MIILAIETAASLCAACLWDTSSGEKGRSVRDLGKGHAEHLMAVIAEAMGTAGVGYPDIGAIAVSVGPGSFTGVRVGVSAARGLALALSIPAVGVGALEALAVQAQQNHPGRAVLALVEAGRGQVYVAAFAEDGATTLEPTAVTHEGARALIEAAGPATVLTGSAAAALADSTGGQLTVAQSGVAADVAVFAALAARRLGDPAAAPPERPRPLYLRDADAKPQASFILPRAEER